LRQRKLVGLVSVLIEYSDLGDIKFCQRKRDRLADAACADQGDGPLPRAFDQVAYSPRKTRGVGVVTDQSVIADHDGVDCADGRRTRRQFVEQIDNRFLVGKRHVDAGKAEPTHAVQQRAQLLTARAGNLDQMIVVADTQGMGSLLMHRRRG
jgi:hypothetical protein